MRQAVEHDQIVLAGHGGDYADVGGITGGEQAGFFAAFEFRQVGFQLFGHRKGANQQRRTARARAVPGRGFLGGEDDFRMRGETEIVVRRQNDHLTLPAQCRIVDQPFGVVGAHQHPAVEIATAGGKVRQSALEGSRRGVQL